MRRLFPLIALAVTACGSEPAVPPPVPKVDAVVRISLPDEPPSRLGGSDPALIEANCLACHSVEMITVQPKLPAAKWAATIEKMRTVYGAQIAKADEPRLIAALQSAQR